MIREEPREFDSSYVVLFDSVPDQSKLEANQVGVNYGVFKQLKLHFKHIRHNSAYRILADCCLDIQDNGLIGDADESAQRLGLDRSTIFRWRGIFANEQVLIWEYEAGGFSVSPKVALRMNAQGKPVRFRRRKSVFQF